MIFDARIPQPFSEPMRWAPIPAEADTVLLSLPVAASSGGMLSRFFESVVDSGKQIIWSWPEAWFNHANEFKRMLIIDEARSWLATSENSHVALAPEFIEIFCGELSFPIERIATTKLSAEPTLAEWLKSTFSNASSQVTELEWHRIAKHFEVQLGDFIPSDWQSLGFFPGFLRKEAPQLADQASLDWARIAAAYSPVEVASGVTASGGRSLIVNPTINSVRVANQKLVAIARRQDNSLSEKELNWREAALIDELSEQPKISREGAVAAVSAELAGAEAKLGQTVSWDEALETLIKEELVLQI